MSGLVGIGVYSFMLALSGALMPGPLLTATIGESVRHGPRAGPLLVAGHALLEFALVAALFLGLAPLLKDKRVTAGISLAGGAILIGLAFGMFRTLPSLSLYGPGSLKKGRGRLVTSGILVSLSNPYWTVWWATFGLAYILQSREFGIAGVVVFFIGHILADFAWYSLISFSIGKGRRFLTNAMYRWLVGFCAVFLLGFAGWFLREGIKGLLG
ncbi:MAG: LysE family transporter [Chitinispirillaceae bacterium]|nr:LysE family transporter [Chitinispirillaceae bacterium]